MATTYQSAKQAGYTGDYTQWTKDGRPAGGKSTETAATAQSFTNFPKLEFTDRNGKKQTFDPNAAISKSFMRNAGGQRGMVPQMPEQVAFWLSNIDHILDPNFSKNLTPVQVGGSDLNFRSLDDVDWSRFTDPAEAKKVLTSFVSSAQSIAQSLTKISPQDIQNMGNSATARNDAIINLYNQTVQKAGLTTFNDTYNKQGFTQTPDSASAGSLLKQYQDKYPDLKDNSTALYTKALKDNPGLTYANFTSGTTANAGGGGGTGGASATGTGSGNSSASGASTVSGKTYTQFYNEQKKTNSSITNAEIQKLWQDQGGSASAGSFGTDDADFAEFVTYNDYLNSLPDKGASIISQWEALADQEIGDDYTKLNDQLTKSLGIFQESQALESANKATEKATSERYINEDLDRFMAYSNEDRVKGMTQIDTSFAKALSSAASGYLDMGIRLGTGMMRKAAAGIREEVNVQKDNLLTSAQRAEQEAKTTAERNKEQLNQGYEAFLKQQALESKSKTQDATSADEELDIEKKRKKAELVAKQKEEARAVYMNNQLRNY